MTQSIDFIRMGSLVTAIKEADAKVSGMDIVTVIKVTSNNLERFVSDHFNKQWEWVAVEECGNHSSQEYIVYSAISDKDRAKVDEWLFGDLKYPHTYTNNNILNRLCELGLIPAGDYVIDSSW